MPATLAVTALLAGGCAKQEKTEQAGEAARPEPVTITQFYASPPSIARGSASLLCYGVDSAVEVRVEPEVEKLRPALTRCFEVKPASTTSYSLIATGRDGSTATRSVTVEVGAAAAAGPKLSNLQINKRAAKPGELISFCFEASGAASVTGAPGRWQNGGSPAKDCLMHQPQRTTTYRITATGAGGQTDTASITVEVKP
jgi:hypothetical protein